MEIGIAFFVGYVVGHVVAVLLRPKPRPAPENRRRFGSMVPAEVVGVYGTAHTSDGRDIDTGPPEQVRIDCELITFVFPLPRGTEGELASHTLHLGVETAKMSINPPTRIRAGDIAVIVQPLSIGSLAHGEGPLPEWAR